MKAVVISTLKAMDCFELITKPAISVDPSLVIFLLILCLVKPDINFHLPLNLKAIVESFILVRVKILRDSSLMV